MSVGVRYDYFENGNGTKGTHINGLNSMMISKVP